MAAAPNGYRWFQLYVYRDRKLSEQIVHRVEALGYKALVLTVDVPYTGKRRNDIRNQFKLPPHLKVKNFDGVFQVIVNRFPPPLLHVLSLFSHVVYLPGESHWVNTDLNTEGMSEIRKEKTAIRKII